MVEAYRMLARRVPYPLHLGVTEAGTAYTGAIKNAIGIGILLNEGIGATIRVSLTAPPEEEMKACIKRHHPAVGYLNRAQVTEQLAPCF